MKKVLAVVSECKKPVVINFLGGDPVAIEKAGAVPAFTLEETAVKAVSVIWGKSLAQDFLASWREELTPVADSEKRKGTPDQKYLRGLFCGGTHCEEAALILKDFAYPLYANVPLSACEPLPDVNAGYQHSLIDMGAEEFTRGRPHPVIDLAAFKERLWKEGCDPEVRVILFDIILGYGAHPDPAGGLGQTILFIREKAHREGRYVCFVASVCGSDKDPQDLANQERQLREAGVLVVPSNARASILSSLIIT
jgi:hypothetical protein